MQTPKCIVITTIRELPLSGQIVRALARVGFRVATLSPPKSIIRTVQAAQCHFEFQRWAPIKSFVGAIDAWSPDLLFFADDRSVQIAHDVHLRMSRSPRDPDAARIARLIEASLGEPAGFDQAVNRSKLITLAQTMGLRCPDTVVVPDPSKLESALQSIGLPVVLKADETSGGSGVRIVATTQEAQQAYCELAVPNNWPRALRRSLGELSVRPLLDLVTGRRRTVALQQEITGRPANRALACWKGKVLAAVNVEALEVMYKNGPATVIRIIDNLEMSATTDALVARLGITGLCGFDFMVDKAERAWLLEMNPRVTQICHIPFGDGVDLAAAMYCAITGAASSSASGMRGATTPIPLFPGAWLLGQNAAHGSRGYDDVPWDEPEFASACLSLGTSGGWWNDCVEAHRERNIHVRTPIHASGGVSLGTRGSVGFEQ